jgi:hypothetical protein
MFEIDVYVNVMNKPAPYRSTASMVRTTRGADHVGG